MFQSTAVTKSVARLGQGITCQKSGGFKKLVYPKWMSGVVHENYIQNIPKAARTSIKNPGDHSLGHVGMWYTVEPEITNQLFQHCGLTNSYEELTKALGETCLMIREPAVTTMSYLKRSNLQHIPNKFLLYGEQGTGKSLTLMHLIHYLYEEEWIILHVHSPAKWCRLFKEIKPSTTREGFYDHTIDASHYLKHFHSQNCKLLEKLKLNTTMDYQFTQRESIAKGSSLLSLIDFGIQRSRYGSEVVYNLNTELKKYANEGRCKVSLVFDGVNTFFHPVSFFVTDDRTVVPPHQFTLFAAFRMFCQPDWKNGCIIGSVNIEMSTKDRRKSHLPRYLLRKEGWDTFDPFIPICVKPYSQKEIHSVIDYYIETNWLQHHECNTPEGRQELSFISGGNPSELISLINVH